MTVSLQRNGRSFHIDAREAYSCWWFRERFPGWETQTFQILERFLKPGKVYLDIGAWIGPTALYAASLGAQTHALEPDPVAFQRLQRNLEANPDFKDVHLHQLALAAGSGMQPFGGNGELGNSESTLLVNEVTFLHKGGLDRHWHGDDPLWRKGQQVQVKTLTLKDFLESQCLSPEHITLIKMDIEGSEKQVLPTLEAALGKARPPLYLSLHRVFLQETEIVACIDTLKELYSGLYNMDMQRVSMTEILDMGLEDLLCLPE